MYEIALELHLNEGRSALAATNSSQLDRSSIRSPHKNRSEHIPLRLFFVQMRVFGHDGEEAGRGSAFRAGSERSTAVMPTTETIQISICIMMATT